MWQGIPHQAGSSSTPEGPSSTGQQRGAHLPRVQSGVQAGEDYEGALGNPHPVEDCPAMFSLPKRHNHHLHEKHGFDARRY